MWPRAFKDEKGQRDQVGESARWIEGYERVAERAAALPNTRLVYVADRESDLMALRLRAYDLGTPADWLLRAQHNRALPNGHKLWDEWTTETAWVGDIGFTLNARPGQAAREVKCRENGAYPQELEQWRAAATQALADPEDTARISLRDKQADRRRIKELERDLRRKEKALAEAAALL